MNPAKRNILITGLPAVGKTTLIKTLFKELSHIHPVGFFTEEIREQGERKGFRLLSPDGTEGILSHVNIQSPFRVGKYGVDIKGFERFLESIQLLDAEGAFVIVDEIGKMECFSKKFLSLIYAVLDSEAPLVATIAQKGGGADGGNQKTPGCCPVSAHSNESEYGIERDSIRFYIIALKY